jgi:hypothetical protein
MKNCWLAVMLSLLSGISWAQCANGTSGTNCTGPLTVQPQSGNNTQSAITLVDLGLPLLAPVTGQYTLSVASGMVVESDNGNSYHSLVGLQGLQGPPGAAGPQGASGATGATGSNGATGVTGAAGPQGAIGATGAAGAVGLTGSAGAAGGAGPAGAAGSVGPAGPAGAQGSAGTQGPQGPQGPAGTIATPEDYSFYYGTGYKASVGTAEVGTFDRDQIDMTNAASVRFIATVGSAALPSGSYAQAEYSPDGTNWFPLSGEVPVTTPNGLYSSGWQALPTAANGDFMVRIVVLNTGSVVTQFGLRQLHLQFK